MRGWQFFHDEVGFNYRMPNLNAALGAHSWSRLDDSSHRSGASTSPTATPSNSLTVCASLKNLPGCRSNYWLQTLVLDEGLEDELNSVLEAANTAGYTSRPAWDLLSGLPPYVNSPRAPLPVAESLSRRIVNVPSSAGLA